MNKHIASLALAMGTALVALPASAKPVISFTPSQQQVAVGGTVNVDVSISGLGAEILSAFDLNFVYNGSIIGGAFRSINADVAAAQLGGAFNAYPLIAIDTSDPGNWGVQASALVDDDTVAANQADSFLLASFAFSADADGVTTFTLGPDLDFERNIVGRDFATMDVTVNGACIAVGTGQCRTNVPEPSSYALVGLALAGLALAGRRRRSAR